MSQLNTLKTTIEIVLTGTPREDPTQFANDRVRDILDKWEEKKKAAESLFFAGKLTAKAITVELIVPRFVVDDSSFHSETVRDTFDGGKAIVSISPSLGTDIAAELADMVCRRLNELEQR